MKENENLLKLFCDNIVKDIMNVREVAPMCIGICEKDDTSPEYISDIHREILPGDIIDSHNIDLSSLLKRNNSYNYLEMILSLEKDVIHLCKTKVKYSKSIEFETIPKEKKGFWSFLKRDTNFFNDKYKIKTDLSFLEDYCESFRTSTYEWSRGPQFTIWVKKPVRGISIETDNKIDRTLFIEKQFYYLKLGELYQMITFEDYDNIKKLIEEHRVSTQESYVEQELQKLNK